MIDRNDPQFARSAIERATGVSAIILKDWWARKLLTNLDAAQAADAGVHKAREWTRYSVVDSVMIGVLGELTKAGISPQKGAAVLNVTRHILDRIFQDTGTTEPLVLAVAHEAPTIEYPIGSAEDGVTRYAVPSSSAVAFAFDFGLDTADKFKAEAGPRRDVTIVDVSAIGRTIQQRLGVYEELNAWRAGLGSKTSRSDS